MTLFFGICIYSSGDFLPTIAFDFSSYVGLLFELVGVLMMASAVLTFRKHKTTLNPLQPDQATSIVTTGTFKVSRNPMYLGMMMILIGVSFQTSLFAGGVFVPAFVLYMTVFQILPEEGAMLNLFGDEYAAYKTAVRRWV